MAEFYLGWKGIKKTLEGRVPGELSISPNASREEKAAATRGLLHIGKQTLKQYEILVSNGYDGREVMKWSAHKADGVIANRGLKLRPEQLEKLAARGRPRKRKKNLQDGKPKEKSMAVVAIQVAIRPIIACPICRVKLRKSRLTSHMRKQHSSIRH